MAGLIVLVLDFDNLQGSVVLSVDPDEESGLSDRAHFLSDYLAVGEDKIVVFFSRETGESFVCSSVAGFTTAMTNSFVNPAGLAGSP
jgi:hypothetical protein